MKMFTQDNSIDYTGHYFRLSKTVEGVDASALRTLFGNPNIVLGKKVWSILFDSGDKYRVDLDQFGSTTVYYNANPSNILTKLPVTSLGKKIVIAKVKSFTTPRKRYEVAKHDCGRFSCTCPHFENRKQECKHITRVKSDLDRLYNIC